MLKITLVNRDQHTRGSTFKPAAFERVRFRFFRDFFCNLHYSTMQSACFRRAAS